MISHPPFPASAAPGTVRPVLQPFFLSPHKVVPDDRPTAAATRNISAEKTVTDTARARPQFSNLLTASDIALPSARPASFLVATPITFPMSAGDTGSRLGDDIAERRLQLRGG